MEMEVVPILPVANADVAVRWYERWSDGGIRTRGLLLPNQLQPAA